MELRQIQYFLQLYEERNITKASQSLFISQQGLSKSIHKLEREIDLLLFERTPSGVIPTKAADQLYPLFVDMINGYHRLTSEIHHIRKERILQIIAPLGFAAATDKELFSEYGRLYPENPTRYQEADKETIISSMKKREVDIAFMPTPIPDEFQSHQVVGRSPIYAVMSSNHPLAKKERVTIPDLENCVFLLLDLYEEFNNFILRKADAAKINYQIYDHAKMNDFLPVMDSSPLLGFSDKYLYRYYNTSNILFVPFFLPDGSSLYVESHLVTLKNTFIDKEMQHYIDWEKDKWGKIF